MDNLIKETGYLIMKASKLARWNLNKRLEEIGLTSSQFAVLKDLDLNSNNDLKSCSLVSIADRLGADKPTITKIIERLEKNQWVVRRCNPKDRRAQIIELCDKAKEILPELEALSSKTMEKAFKGFKEDEINTLNNYLQKMIQNLSVGDV